MFTNGSGASYAAEALKVGGSGVGGGEGVGGLGDNKDSIELELEYELDKSIRARYSSTIKSFP